MPTDIHDQLNTTSEAFEASSFPATPAKDEPREIDERIYNALEAVTRLQGLHRLERSIYMIVATISVLFIFAAIAKFVLLQDEWDRPIAVALLGSGGLLSVASGRIVYFYEGSFRVVEKALDAYLGAFGGGRNE